MLAKLFGLRPAVPRLTWRDEDNKQHRFELTAAKIAIGRGAICDLRLDSAYVAPVHAEVTRREDGAFAIQRKGLNPLFINGRAVSHEVILGPGDKLRLGNSFNLVFEGSPPPPAPKKKVVADQTDIVSADRGTTMSVGAQMASVAAVSNAPLPLLKRMPVRVGLAVYLMMMLLLISSLMGRKSGADFSTEANEDSLYYVTERIEDCLGQLQRDPRIGDALSKSAPKLAGRYHGGAWQAPSPSYLDMALMQTDDEAVKDGVIRLKMAYREVMRAAFVEEDRRRWSQAATLYSRAYLLVPDMRCPAGEYASARLAATEQKAGEAP